jgi:hypothetical protein
MAISIEGLDKALVLAGLYNAARPQGMGFLQYDPAPMTREQAQAIIDGGSLYFDYLKGRVMKVDLSGEEFNEWCFDRDNGQGAAQAVIDVLRSGASPNDTPISMIHEAGKSEAAESVRASIDTESRTEVGDNVATIHLGLAGMKDKLLPAIDEATK